MCRMVEGTSEVSETMSERAYRGTRDCPFCGGKNGRISNVKAIRSPHPELEKAAVRTVKRMPKWIPGKKEGQIVRCSLNLPIMYKTGELYNNKVTITNRNTDEKK